MKSNIKLSILSEFWGLLKTRKKWWLAPIFIFIILLGIFVVSAAGSSLAPLIYTLF